MALALEDYGIIGDTHSAALVSRGGSLDWLCLPRFDSPACFAALLGAEEHGRWSIGPVGDVRSRRSYRAGTLVLDTDLATDEGVVRLTDFMPPRTASPELVRLVEGISGRVRVRSSLAARFDYGSTTPWSRRADGLLTMLAGPDAAALWTPVETRVDAATAHADFVLGEGDRVPFVFTWFPSHERVADVADPDRSLAETERWWRNWSATCTYEGPWRDAVLRSLITLKALTYAPTGGLVAAPTTSLPEQLGGVRNWDYRYCWVRDATFTLYALLDAGYVDEARAWRDWLLRAVAGDPRDFQLMYGVAGERRLPELELEWLPGYEESRPVRIGNAATEQLQLDVFGELMDAMHEARKAGIEPDPVAWDVQRALLDFLESRWREPDSGIWEMRGPARDFTHSKVMAWVAFDRAAKAVDRFRFDGPADRWRRLAGDIHREVCERGFDRERGCFVQYYGSSRLDASLLMIPLVGFLPASDPRVRGTLDAVERVLSEDGLVVRYEHDEDTRAIDGLPPGEGKFLACSFWLADNLTLLGERERARRLFERLLELGNDLGLLSEEYDTATRRLVGNFPQAFSHLSLVNTALNLSRALGPAHERGRTEHEDSVRSKTQSTRDDHPPP